VCTKPKSIRLIIGFVRIEGPALHHTQRFDRTDDRLFIIEQRLGLVNA
jgi:hypothetical protein